MEKIQESFDGEHWEDGATCWQFAVGDNSDDSRLIGDAIGNRVTASQIRRNGIGILKDVIAEEMSVKYGYYVEETEDPYNLPDEACFKLAFLTSSDGIYHVMRMYPDGQWWRKWAGVQPTNIGPVTGGIIRNPLCECIADCYDIFFMDVYEDEDW